MANVKTIPYHLFVEVTDDSLVRAGVSNVTASRVVDITLTTEQAEKLAYFADHQQFRAICVQE